MIRFTAHANAAVTAGRIFAKIDLELAMTSHKSRFAVTSVIIDELNTIKSARCRAWIRETFVHVTLTARSHESWWALAFKGTNAIDASSAVVASAFKAFVNVDFAENTQSAVGTRARECVDKIMTNAAILTRARVAVVDVVLAVGTLEAWRAGTRVRTD